MAEKVTKMVIKVDLSCEKCRKKIKCVLCGIPQVQDRIFDDEQNTVAIKVVCCSPEKVKKMICSRGGKTVKGVEIIADPPPPPPPECGLETVIVVPAPLPAPAPAPAPVPIPAPVPVPEPKAASEPGSESDSESDSDPGSGSELESGSEGEPEPAPPAKPEASPAKQAAPEVKADPAKVPEPLVIVNPSIYGGYYREWSGVSCYGDRMRTGGCWCSECSGNGPWWVSYGSGYRGGDAAVNHCQSYGRPVYEKWDGGPVRAYRVTEETPNGCFIM